MNSTEKPAAICKASSLPLTPEMVGAFWDEFLAWKQEGDNQEALEDGESGDQASLAERALAWAQKCLQRD